MTVTRRPMVLKVPIEVRGVDRPAGVAVPIDEPRATRLEDAGKAEGWAIGSEVPIVRDDTAGPEGDAGA